MNIIIAFACIYQDGIEVSGQVLTMCISYNDQNLDLNQNPGHLWPVTVIFVLCENSLPAWCELQDVQRSETPSSIQFPWKRTVALDLNAGWEEKSRVFFLSRLVLGFCSAAVSPLHLILHYVQQHPCEGLCRSPGSSGKWADFWQLKVTKNQVSCLDCPNGSIHAYISSILAGMITYCVMQTRVKHSMYMCATVYEALGAGETTNVPAGLNLAFEHRCILCVGDSKRSNAFSLKGCIHVTFLEKETKVNPPQQDGRDVGVTEWGSFFFFNISIAIEFAPLLRDEDQDVQRLAVCMESPKKMKADNSSQSHVV